ncbi:MAG: GntR family transcriptional regulator/MocR family aminotransferase, partial [Paraglaciecola sp.]
EKQFCFDKNNDRDGFIRLGFAGMNENKFAEGIELLVNSLTIKH